MTLAKAPASRNSNPNATDGDEGQDQLTAAAIIESLGGVLVEKRTEAMNWRKLTGIEDDWEEDDEFYDARDRANPEGDTNVGKPVASDGGAENRPVQNGRSSVFIPITRAYVDAASARVSDMLLPNDDAPWQLRATPRAEMSAAGGNMTPVAAAAAGAAGTGPMPMMPQGLPGAAGAGMGAMAMMNPGPSAPAPAAMGAQQGMAAPQQAGGGMPPGQPMPMGVTSQVYEALPDEDKRAERANKIIEDWHVECQFHAEARKAIEDSARLGTGILKGPFPVQKKSKVYRMDPITRQYVVEEQVKVVPITKRVHPRNFWTDPAGGENHQAGSYTWELDNIGSRALRALLDDDSYIRDNILRALREGPGAKSGKDQPAENTSYSVNVGATFPLWYFYGDLDKMTMIAAGVPEEMLPEGEDEAVAIPALVIMVNDHVIKVAAAPLDTGGFPYDMFPWQSRPGIPWGKGVARQMRTAQRMLNAGVRAEMDNAGITSGPQWAIRKGWVQAIDGNDSILGPRKGWYITDKAPPNAKLEDCISYFNVTSNIAELERIIDRAMRFAEDSTGLPMLMQGQQGEATTTATGMTILNNNGSTVLRRIARTFDDFITEPHIRRYYYWLMANEGNDDAKGDFQIDARGSTYLVDRELQAQNLNMLFPMLVQHPDVHPGRLAEEVAAANRLPLKRIMLTEAERKARDEAPPPKSDAVQVAEIRAGVDEKKLQQKEMQDMRMAKVAEGKLQAEVERGIGELAVKLGISEDSIKAMMAVETMRHAVSGAERMRDRMHERTSAAEERHAEPPGEPPHRAPAGEAYTQ
jgi:hypothetical protein